MAIFLTVEYISPLRICCTSKMCWHFCICTFMGKDNPHIKWNTVQNYTSSIHVPYVCFSTALVRVSKIYSDWNFLKQPKSILFSFVLRFIDMRIVFPINRQIQKCQHIFDVHQILKGEIYSMCLKVTLFSHKNICVFVLYILCTELLNLKISLARFLRVCGAFLCIKTRV